MQITPGAGESAALSIVHSLRSFLSFPIQELSLVPFSTMRAREEAVSAHRSLCRQRLGWAAGFLPALWPLTPPAHPPLMNGPPPDTSSCCFCQAAHLDFTHSPDKNRQGWPGLAGGSIQIFNIICSSYFLHTVGHLPQVTQPAGVTWAALGPAMTWETPRCHIQCLPLFWKAFLRAGNLDRSQSAIWNELSSNFGRILLGMWGGDEM